MSNVTFQEKFLPFYLIKEGAFLESCLIVPFVVLPIICGSTIMWATKARDSYYAEGMRMKLSYLKI